MPVHSHNWEDQGRIGTQNASLLKMAAYLLKRRSARTSFTWVKGHRSLKGNEESDKLTKEGAKKEQHEELDLQIPTEFDNIDIQGVTLATITQSTAYNGIREKKPKPQRQSTMENLQTTREVIEAICGTTETDAKIWTSIRGPNLRLRVQQLLYKTIHKAYMTGDKWTKIPNFEDRAIGAKCIRQNRCNIYS